MSKFHEQLKGGDGVQALYEKVVTIKSVTPKTREEEGENGKDVNLTLELSRKDANGEEKLTTLWLNGDFWARKNEPEKGKCNMPIPINDLFKAVNVAAQLAPEEGDEVYDTLRKGEFPMIILPMIEGKDIKILEYIAGTYENAAGEIRPSYNKWNKVAKPNHVGLKAAFLAEHGKSGYPKKFSPELVKQANEKTGPFAPQTEEDAEYAATVTQNKEVF